MNVRVFVMKRTHVVSSKQTTIGGQLRLGNARYIMFDDDVNGYQELYRFGPGPVSESTILRRFISWQRI